MSTLARAAAAALAVVATTMAMEAQTPAPAMPKLTFAFEIRATVATPTDLGLVPHGRRRIVNITGGTFEGPGLKGRIVPGGADWQMIQPDGFSELDTRYTLETDKGEIVYVQNRGVRHAPPDVMKRLNAGETVDPALVYFRTVPTFETSSPDLQWLARSVFIGIGQRFPNDVRVQFWKVE